jgi:hypothetical protein
MMSPLPVDRGAMAKTRVTTTRAVPAVGPLEHEPLCLGRALGRAEVENFSLKCGKEALCHCVGLGITDRAHRRHDGGLLKAIANGVVHEVVSSIRVMERATESAPVHRHLGVTQGPLGTHVYMHRPDADIARVRVQHHLQIQPV